MMWRARLFCRVAISVLLLPVAAAAQPPVRVTVVDAGNTPLQNAHVCLYHYPTGRQLPSHSTDANGRTTLDYGSIGAQDQVALVVSKDGYRGSAVGPQAFNSLRGRTVQLAAGAGNTGPVCADTPTVTLFTIDDKAATTASDRVTLQLWTSASYDHEVQYCGTEAAEGCAADQVTGWVSLGSAEAQGFKPAFTPRYTLKRLGTTTIYVRFRWLYNGEAGPVGPTASATIERVAHAIAIRTFALNGGAAMTTSPDLDLDWISEPPPADTQIRYCAKESGEDCGDDDWKKPESPATAVPGIGLKYQGKVSVTPSPLAGFLPVKRTVDLRVRYEGYPGSLSEAATDSIYLLQPPPPSGPIPPATMEYPIAAGQFVNLAMSRGWQFNVSDATHCLLDIPTAPAGIQPVSIGTTDSCNFDLFVGGSLAPGWSFDFLEVDTSRSLPSALRCNFTTMGMPPVGGNSLHTRIAIASQIQPICLFCCPFCPLEPPGFCVLDLTRIHLIGPLDRDWREAVVAAPGASP